MLFFHDPLCRLDSRADGSAFAGIADDTERHSGKLGHALPTCSRSGLGTSVEQGMRADKSAQDERGAARHFVGRAMSWAGAPSRVSAASCRTVPGGIGALVSIDGSQRPLSLLVTYTESGQIAMIRVLSPDESAPW